MPCRPPSPGPLARRAPACLALLLAAAACPTLAEPAPNLAPAGAAQPTGAVHRLMLAWDLQAIALARDDALMLLTALRLARPIAQRQATGWERTGPEAAPAPDGPATAGLPADPASDAALALAQMATEGDPALADLAEEMLASPELAPGRGGRINAATFRLPEGGVDSWRIPFNGQLPAEVAVIGDGSGNLDLSVSDDGGFVVCAEDGPADRAFCGFTPARNGWFVVTVANRGPGPGTYRLVTN